MKKLARLTIICHCRLLRFLGVLIVFSPEPAREPPRAAADVAQAPGLSSSELENWGSRAIPSGLPSFVLRLILFLFFVWWVGFVLFLDLRMLHNTELEQVMCIYLPCNLSHFFWIIFSSELPSRVYYSVSTDHVSSVGAILLWHGPQEWSEHPGESLIPGKIWVDICMSLPPGLDGLSEVAFTLSTKTLNLLFNVGAWTHLTITAVFSAFFPLFSLLLIKEHLHCFFLCFHIQKEQHLRKYKYWCSPPSCGCQNSCYSCSASVLEFFIFISTLLEITATEI